MNNEKDLTLFKINFFTSADILETGLLMVLLHIDTSCFSFSLAFPRMRLTAFNIQGLVRASPTLWALFRMAVSNATICDASTNAALCLKQLPVLSSF